MTTHGLSGRITIDIEDPETAHDQKQAAWMLRQIADEIEKGDVGSKYGDKWTGTIWMRRSPIFVPSQYQVARYTWQRRPKRSWGIL